MNEWISVEDRLPENLDGIITYRDESGLVTPATFLNGDFQGISINSGGFVKLGGNITHWMPLPEPPNETL
jgi:hypothetical protein